MHPDFDNQHGVVELNWDERQYLLDLLAREQQTDRYRHAGPMTIAQHANVVAHLNTPATYEEIAAALSPRTDSESAQ